MSSAHHPVTHPGFRQLDTLPKAHLHLHFTGSLRISTLADLADRHGIRLPHALRQEWPPQLTSSAQTRGWFRFQRLYDAARHCIRDESDMRRVLREAVQDDADEGSCWLELQIDPTSYAPYVGGLTPALEIVLDEARLAAHSHRIGVGIIVAASRMRHPLEARTLARLAARYAGQDSGSVVGFGLSNDERRGDTGDFAAAFRIARNAGLASVPHGGELMGAEAVHRTLDLLSPARLGHGIRSVEDPRLLERLAEQNVALEVCPQSNVALGVFEESTDVPLRTVMDAGVRVALGADDPLLFGGRLNSQYHLAREVHQLNDDQLARLARESVEASRAPDGTRRALINDIDSWLHSPAALGPGVLHDR
ncbi:Aminodeoxyfutalosine deaminase [Austwickia sp. TVS 96-490-7B]|nr:adenosine deaminase [Austwickia sp. TVS 96-490-7B]MBW3085705.1 Aminodeoxyfutalosine deaminase [Austwickia sp. TVS 96-490-7B]